MDTEAANLFFSLLAFVAFAVAGVALIASVLAVCSVRARRRVVATLTHGWEQCLALGFGVALVATIGSLYYSEVADFVPCELCWYQRICMYPLVVVLGIGWLRRDAAAGWYALPFALVGGSISTYHLLVERYPSLGDGLSCSLEAPCTVPYFREFGWVTLAVMALAGFVAILACSVGALVGEQADRTMAAS